MVLEAALVPPPQSGASDVLTAVPSETEVRLALQLMKNGQALGTDDISAELLKLCGEKVVQWLVHLAQAVLEEKKVPKDWVKQLTVPLYKKGSLQDCNNYMGIALLSVPGKVFTYDHIVGSPQRLTISCAGLGKVACICMKDVSPPAKADYRCTQPQKKKVPWHGLEHGFILVFWAYPEDEFKPLQRNFSFFRG